MQCIDACIELDGPGQVLADAGSEQGSLCPEPPFPCERLCWELDARFGRGRPTTLTDVDTSDDTDLRAIGEPLIRCAHERAEACRVGSAAAGVAGPEPVTWTRLFLECAGLPADLDALD